MLVFRDDLRMRKTKQHVVVIWMEVCVLTHSQTTLRDCPSEWRERSRFALHSWPHQTFSSCISFRLIPDLRCIFYLHYLRTRRSSNETAFLTASSYPLLSHVLAKTVNTSPSVLAHSRPAVPHYSQTKDKTFWLFLSNRLVFFHSLVW